MKHRRLLLVVLILAAFALRLWYTHVNALLPQFSNADDGDYYQRALRFVITGKYVDDSWLIRPPLHVWLFAACMKLALLFGHPASDGVAIVQMLQAAMGASLVWFSFSLASRLFNNQRAGLLFAAFWALWFPFIDLSSTLFSEPLYLFLFIIHLWLLVRYDDLGRLRDLALAGLLLGLAALTRSPALYALVFAVPWLATKAFRQTPASLTFGRRLLASRSALRPFAVLVATTLLVVLPWTARNWVVYHRFIPVDTLGPINLWLDLGETSERNAKITILRTLPQADRQTYAGARAKEILQADPLRPFRPMWGTFRNIVKAQFTEDFFVKRSAFNRALRPVAWLGLAGDVVWLVWMTAGLIGLLHPATDRALKWVFILWLAYSILTVLVFHVEPRYLLTIWLLLAIYGSWTLAQGRRILPALRVQRLRGTLVAAGFAGFLLMFVTYRNYPAILARGFRRERWFVAGEQAFSRNDYPAAEQAFRAALVADPGYIDGQVALAATLGAAGRPAEGLALLNPKASQQSELMAGVLSRAVGQTEGAAELLEEGERLVNLDVQHWAQTAFRAEPRTEVVLGNHLDLGYITGFALGEQAGDRSLRWLEGSGELILPLPAPLAAGDAVHLDLAAPIPLDGLLTLNVNDGPTISIQPPATWRTIVLPVPPSAIGQTTLRVRLSAPTFTPLLRDPQSTDPRALSVMVHRIALRH